MASTVSVRIGKEELSEISKLSKEGKTTKSDVLGDALKKGISEKKLEIALDKYKNHEASAAKAANLAGIPLSRFFDILFEKKIELNYTLEDFRQDAKEML